MRRLYSITIETDDDNFYRIIPDQLSKDFGAKPYTVKANDEMIKRFLRRCKMANCDIEPRSYRSITYEEIKNLIKNGKYFVYVFSNKYPKSQEDFQRIIGE